MSVGWYFLIFTSFFLLNSSVWADQTVPQGHILEIKSIQFREFKLDFLELSKDSELTVQVKKYFDHLDTGRDLANQSSSLGVNGMHVGEQYFMGSFEDIVPNEDQVRAPKKNLVFLEKGRGEFNSHYFVCFVFTSIGQNCQLIPATVETLNGSLDLTNGWGRMFATINYDLVEALVEPIPGSEIGSAEHLLFELNQIRFSSAEKYDGDRFSIQFWSGDQHTLLGSLGSDRFVRSREGFPLRTAIPPYNTKTKSIEPIQLRLLLPAVDRYHVKFLYDEYYGSNKWQPINDKTFGLADLLKDSDELTPLNLNMPGATRRLLMLTKLKTTFNFNIYKVSRCAH